MKTEKEIRERIKEVRKAYKHVLTGSLATVFENAPRALMQLEGETKLDLLYWVLGKEYNSRITLPRHQRRKA